MSERAAYTLILIKADLLARADFGPLPALQPMGFWQQAQSGNVRLYYSLEAAQRFASKLGRTVWVLSEEFWTQSLSLPRSAVAGLDREQIRRTLGFEVESLTGIGAADSVIGFLSAAQADEHEQFWLTEVPAATRSQIQRAVSDAGATLAGLVHPGGLPVFFGEEPGSQPPASWRRVEVWKDATLCLSGSNDRCLRVRVINGDVSQESWRTAVQRWMDALDTEQSQWLGPRGPMVGQTLPAGGRTWLSLPDLTGDFLREWLVRWARELAARSDSVPVIEPEQARAIGRLHIAVATALALVCLLTCVGRGMWLKRAQADLKTEIAQIEAPQKQFQLLEQKAGDIRAQLKQARAITVSAKPPPIVADLDQQQRRIEGLLGCLASQADNRVVIEKLTPEPQGVVLVEGSSIDHSAADEFVRNLGMALPGCGWDVDPAEMLTAAGAPIGGLCQFRLRAIPLSSQPAAAPVRPRSRAGG